MPDRLNAATIRSRGAETRQEFLRDSQFLERQQQQQQQRRQLKKTIGEDRSPVFAAKLEREDRRRFLSKNDAREEDRCRKENRERVRERVCVCVCVRERKRERELGFGHKRRRNEVKLILPNFLFGRAVLTAFGRASNVIYIILLALTCYERALDELEL